MRPTRIPPGIIAAAAVQPCGRTAETNIAMNAPSGARKIMTAVKRPHDDD
jgi:hypothetical protein